MQVELRYPDAVAETAIQRRPGGRSARVREAVLDATLALVAEVGIEKLSIAAVAARADVHETSVYRRWKTRENLIIDALLNYSEQHLPIPDTGSLRGDLSRFGATLATYLATPMGRALVQALATAAEDPSIAEARASFWQARYELARTMIERAVSRGEIAPSTDARLVLEALVAPLNFRALMAAEPDPDFAARLSDVLVDGLLRRG